MIEIDGSIGEGGGQVLRSALSLSMLSGLPVRLTGIRAHRSNPGLAPQHRTAVRAAARICSARVEGDRLRSTELTFNPDHMPQGGRYSWNVDHQASNGSAGSTSLVLQTVLVPLAFSEQSSILKLHGGTHVSWSPPYHYIDEVYRPVLEKIGYRFEGELRRWGFFPRGGGLVECTVDGQGPTFQPLEFNVNRRGDLLDLRGISVVGNLDPDILHRQTRAANNELETGGFNPVVESVPVESHGPGTAVVIVARYENISAGFSACGKKGKPAEQVAAEAVNSFSVYHDTEEPVDPHLADQLIVPLVAGRGPSHFRTSRVTSHLKTNLRVAQHFTDRSLEVKGDIGEPGIVSIGPGTLG